MTAAETATKRYVILNDRTDLAQQIIRAQESGEPLVLTIESGIGNNSELTINLRMYLPTDAEDDLLFAISERKEDVTVYLPKNQEEPALAYLPN